MAKALCAMTLARVHRARVLTAIESKDALSVLGADEKITRLTGDSASLASAVLSFVLTPRTRDEIFAHVAELTGEPIENLAIVGELLDLLKNSGALVPYEEPATPAPATRKLLLGIGGAVAAAHAPVLIQSLQARGLDVRVIASESALRFVAKESLEAITHHAVLSSMWQRDEGLHAPHIELAAWPDLMVLWPATATTLSRIATGDCSELLSTVAIATRAPVMIAPSMNAAMYDAPSVQRNIERLKADGFHLVAPAFAVEVAQAPEARTPMLGGAPPPEALAALVEAMFAILQGSTAPEGT
jgi:3-polyprenyl-4-hydroxybenzoate decarboxylase